MRFSNFMPALAVVLLLSACGSAKEDNQVTETRMDNLDSLEGTISDDMIITDESTDEARVEAAPASSEPAGTEAPKPETAPTKSEAADTAETEEAAKSK